MKSSLGKLRKFALHRSDDKEKKERQHMLRLDEFDQASQLLLYQDMQDMRSCYDNLLSAAAAATNSVYEFSESLQDIGTCFLQKAARNVDDDDESYKLLSMLGKTQFDLQKLFDIYRSHILLTITTPSESLLRELRTVEEMKLQCDEKRKIYEHIAAQYQEKGKSKSGKGENVFSKQLKAAHDEYIEVESCCTFRLKSLKQGQWRSLLTQAARHHAAQMSFLRKGLKSLEAIAPLLNKVTKEQRIDYQLDGFEDEGNGDNIDGYGSSGDEETCFDYRENKQLSDAISGSRNSIEENHPSKVESRWSSYSAPIFPEKKLNPGYKIRDLPQVPARKSHSYVLPTPDDAKKMTSGRANSSVPKLRPVYDVSRSSHQSQWHSSPLQQQPQKEGKDFIDVTPLDFASSKPKVKVNSNTTPSSLLIPSIPGSSDIYSVYDGKRPRRQAFSGPLSSKGTSGAKPSVSVSGPISNSELPPQILLSRVPVSISPKVSPASSPPIASSPKISELHELPRPPSGRSSVVPPMPVTSSSGYSGPLIHKNQEPPPPLNKSHVTAFSNPTPLPIPPPAVRRSFSIPSINQRAMATHVAKLLESPQYCERAVEVSSPPLTPMSLSKIKPLSIGSEAEEVRSK